MYISLLKTFNSLSYPFVLQKSVYIILILTIVFLRDKKSEEAILFYTFLHFLPTRSTTFTSSLNYNTISVVRNLIFCYL